MSATPIRLCIDGVWQSCLPTDDFGFLGTRYVCTLGRAAGQSEKKLLLRLVRWPQGKDAPVVSLQSGDVHGTQASGVRPAAMKSYDVSVPQADGKDRVNSCHVLQVSVPQADGKDRVNSCHVLQQDITDLVPLRIAAQQALREGKPDRFWRLFYSACKALREMGEASGNQVPLQCPLSLAVAPGGRVLPLDAAVQVAGPISGHAQAQSVYQFWFGAGSSGYASPKDASLLHSKALLRFFRQLQHGQKAQAPPQGGNPAVLERLGQRLEALALVGDVGLDVLEGSLREIADEEDWSLPLDDEDETGIKVASIVVPVTSALANPPQALPTTPIVSPHKKLPLLSRLSLYLNLLLLLVVMVLWLLWSRARTSSATSGPSGFSSYCVVFPAPGTLPEKVRDALEELFPGKVIEVPSTAAERDNFREAKLQELIKGLKQPDEQKALLVRLASKHGGRFKGVAASEADPSLATVIQRGGIFTLTSKSPLQHGSLLQADGLDKVLDAASLKQDREARELLESLGKAIFEYACLSDALNIGGLRPGAYLLQVEPTATAHEAARAKLLSRLDNPVFVGRPLLEMFDGVDPTADSGGGFARYSLTLNRKSYWRLVSARDRQEVDPTRIADKTQLRWQTFERDRKIEWQPITVSRIDGSTHNVSSFDVAVMMPARVVIFRNQNLILGKSREEVRTAGRRYVTQGLGLIDSGSEEVISISETQGQFTGALMYSYLAELVPAEPTRPGVNVQVSKPDEFEQTRQQEDASLGS